MVSKVGVMAVALLAVASVAQAQAQAQTRPMARPADLVPPAPPVEEDPTLAAMAPEAALEAMGGVETPRDPNRGRVTELPLPRYVSLKGTEGNARRGPSLDHRIDWVFVRQDMPLRITDEHGHWRRIEDREGMGGWVHYSLLSGSRTVLVDAEDLSLRSRPDEAATEVARLERDVVARVESCEIDWCRLSAGGFRGYAPKTALWGVGAEEILD